MQQEQYDDRDDTNKKKNNMSNTDPNKSNIKVQQKRKQAIFFSINSIFSTSQIVFMLL